MNKTSAAIFCPEVVLLKSHVLLTLSKNSAMLTQCTTPVNLLISSDLIPQLPSLSQMFYLFAHFTPVRLSTNSKTTPLYFIPAY